MRTVLRITPFRRTSFREAVTARLAGEPSSSFAQRRKRGIAALTAMAAMAGLAGQAAASDAPASGAPTSQGGPLLPAWNSFVEGLRELGPKMLEKLPERLRNDPQVQQEVGRLMLEALAARSLEAIGADGDHPMFLPSLNLVMNINQPNADTIYKQAAITPGGTYRLRGRRGSLRIARIGVMVPPSPDGKVRAAQYLDLNKLPTDAEGNFDVLLSAVKPEGYRGAWWELDSKGRLLLLRQVAYDWAKERDPVISIERVDAPAPRPRPDAAALEDRLRRLAPDTSSSALFLIDHPEKLRRDGALNKFQEWDVTGGFGGIFGQFYYETAYQLRNDEALVLEVDYPKNCSYASLLLTNDIFETTDWYNNHSSLNGAQWRVDADGKLRVVVSARDPGIGNWLDTAGYPSGVIQGRWTECDATPIPTVKQVPIGQVAKLLPPGTPRVSAAERDRIVRDRRAAFQQRVLW